MKKLTAFLLAAVLVFALCACGGNPDPAAQTDNVDAVNNTTDAGTPITTPDNNADVTTSSLPVSEKERIAELCSDSIEYFINDDQWLFWEDIQLETGITLDKNSQRLDFPLTFEKVVNEDEYLIVILDFRAETTGDESKAYFESVRTMLIQQKKNQFIHKRMKELYQEAEKKGKINQ